ncbi:MAG: hypothetical protein Q8R01_17120 [Ramlibacter sp.]|nr:hypothetical protein [Ramlibacter sp.]
MRIPALSSLLMLLAGCSVVPPAAWTFNPTSPAPREALAMADVVALTDRAAQLQLQRHEIRARIAAEPDIWARQRLYAQLHAVGMALSPIERRLATVAAAR